MPAELRLHGAHDVAGLGRECGGLELGDHVALLEPSQVAALLLGGAVGPFLGEVGEILAGVDLRFEVFGLLLIGDEDVGRANLIYHAGVSFKKYIYSGMRTHI